MSRHPKFFLINLKLLTEFPVWFTSASIVNFFIRFHQRVHMAENNRITKFHETVNQRHNGSVRVPTVLES